MKDLTINYLPFDWNNRFFIIHNGDLMEVKCIGIKVHGDEFEEVLELVFRNAGKKVEFCKTIAVLHNDVFRCMTTFPKIWKSVNDYKAEQLDGRSHSCWKEFFGEGRIGGFYREAFAFKGIGFDTLCRDEVDSVYRDYAVFARYRYNNGMVVPVIFQNEVRSVSLFHRKRGDVCRISCTSFLGDNTYESREECMADNMPQVIEYN